MRVGIGYDVHRLVQDRKLVLGGVEIPYIKGLEGYSDADVLLHALCDALLGAAGEADIGKHFPTNDPSYKDCSSLELLKKVSGILVQKGFTIENVDTTVVAEEPNLSPFKQKMADTIARTLGLNPGKVNVKATTTEGLGPVGVGQAISSYAIVSLKSKKGRFSTK